MHSEKTIERRMRWMDKPEQRGGCDVARSIPKWFERWAEGAVEQWEHNGRLYVIRHIERTPAGVEWCLDYADLDGNGGGGAPFSTRDELEEYVRICGLRPYEQLTLGI